jgi:hypothetical protein
MSGRLATNAVIARSLGRGQISDIGSRGGIDGGSGPASA